MITFTKMAEDAIASLLNSKPREAGQGFRLSVEKGGCAGMQYDMRVCAAQEDDYVIALEHGASVFIDKASSGYMRGCELDYSDSLNDSGFKINNPNAARSCGCGTSFEPQAISELEVSKNAD